MKLEDGGAALRVNEHVRLVGIPAKAHRYEVNGRTPLGWFIDRYKVTRDRRSGIVNDPNGLVRGAAGPDRRDPPDRPRERRDGPDR